MLEFIKNSTLGAETMGAETMGAETMGAETMGAETMGLSKSEAQNPGSFKNPGFYI